MTEAEDLDALYEQYQQLLDQNEAMDGDHYESKIRKSLAVAGMSELAETKLADISGGEYKMLQIMRKCCWHRICWYWTNRMCFWISEIWEDWLS